MAKRSLQQARSLVPAGVAVIGATYGLARYGYGLSLPEFRAAFGLSTAAAGGIASGSLLAYCLTALVGGRLVARGRARLTLWLAGGTAALGSVVVAAAWSEQALAAGVLVAGGGAGFATPALVEAVRASVPPQAEPRAQGVVNSGTGAGVVLGGLVVLTAPAAWRWAWAGFAVVALLATWWADRSATWPAGGRTPPPAGRRGALAGLRRPLLAAVVAGAGSASVWTFGRDLLTQAGVSAGVSSLLWCLLGAAGLAGGLSGHLVGRVGVRLAWPATVAPAAVAVVLLATAPGALPAAAVSLTLFGAAFVGLTGVLIAWAAEEVPHAPGRATAVVFTGLTVGQAAGAVVLGTVADGTGVLAAFLLAAGLLALAATATLRPCAPPGSRREMLAVVDEVRR
jgi:predicted MFS family arabinose efflux permease